MLTTQDKEVNHLALEDRYDWPVKWRMEFKVWKCQVMHMGNNNPRNLYEMEGKALAATTEEKDIRVTVTSNLKSSAQEKRRKQFCVRDFPLFHYRDRLSLHATVSRVCLAALGVLYPGMVHLDSRRQRLPRE
jgi:hypothetical protein